MWRDAVVLGVLAAIAKWPTHLKPALPVCTFGLSYLIVMTLVLAKTRTWSAFLALGFLWPSFLLPYVEGWRTVVLGVVLVLVIWQGHRKSLQNFPWRFLSDSQWPNPSGTKSGLNMEIRLDGLGRVPAYLGWPNLALSPKFERRPVPISTSFLVSALVGWWSYCVIKSSNMEPVPGLILVIAVVAAMIRLVIFCAGVMPPFNVWGRISTRRIVLPGFDQVFVTPLVVILLGIVGGMLIRRSGVWYASVEASAIVILFFMSFTGGPTLRNWILTGHLRFRPAFKPRADNQMLRRV